MVSSTANIAPEDVEESSPAGNLVKYCPHAPWPKQRLALDIECREVFYGGAAGPGKTDWLLMSALEYVHIPRYSALILRRDMPRLALPGSIMDRSKEWLIGTDARWNEQRKTWAFPSGAKIQFGYIDNMDDRFRYASAEFQFIGWDELTEFRLPNSESNPYLFLMSRLRRTHDNPAPLRVRSASNPGNIGHLWVKSRFQTDQVVEGEMRQIDDEKIYIPGKIEDNPALDAAEYEKSLMHLPAITRQRLMKGDWSVQENSQISSEWPGYYRYKGPTLLCHRNDGEHVGNIDVASLRRYITIDTAGTSKQKAEEKKGKDPSWSCAFHWGHHRSTNRLFLLGAWRRRVDWPQLKSGSIAFVKRCNLSRDVHIENAHFGPALIAEMKAAGIQAVPIGPTIPGMKSVGRKVSTGIGVIEGKKAKLERAIAGGLFTCFEEGRVFFPSTSDVEGASQYMPDLEAELYSWTGDETEMADQIDVLSYAAYLTDKAQTKSWGGVIRN